MVSVLDQQNASDEWAREDKCVVVSASNIKPNRVLATLRRDGILCVVDERAGVWWVGGCVA